MSEKLEVLGNNVLVRLHPAPEKNGSLWLPDQAKEQSCRGEVLGIGPGRRLDDGTMVPLGVKVGQVLLFRRWPSQDVPGEKDLVIVEGPHVLAVVEGKA